MKSILKYIKIGLFLCFLSWSCPSCDDYLDQHPDDILTLDMVFGSEPRVQEWLSGIYNNIPDPTWIIPHDYGFDILADEAQIPLDWAQFGWWPTKAQQGAWSPSNTGPDFWTETYKAVRSAYILQNRIAAIPSQNLTQERVDLMKLETRFLVAYYYSFMLELYGPFPLITSLVNENAPLDELLQSRTPYDEIVNWLDAEFKDLADQLPLESAIVQTGNYYGRPTKGMALACRARMLLFAASPLFNGNPLYNDIKNSDGVNLFPTSYDPNKWVRAKEATEDLLNLGVYKLYTEINSSTGVIDPFLSFQNLFFTRGDVNKEIIFVRPGGTNYATYASHCSPKGHNNRGNDGYCVTQQLVDAFFTKKGLPISNDPDYKSTEFSTQDIYYTNTSYDLSTRDRTKGLITPGNTFNMYVNREPRFYVTVTYNNLYIPTYENNTEFFDGGADGKNGGWDYPPTGYLNRKKVSPDDSPKTGAFPYRPGIVMRLGEFYLNYAEILNEIDYSANKAKAIEYLNKIRERAGIPLYGNAAGQVEIPKSYKDMQTAIRNERRVELAMEGIRYRDMRRWLIGRDLYDNQPITGMNTLGNATTFYDNSGKHLFLKRIWSDKMYLWPIPQSAMDKNARLIQNYQWSVD